MGPGQYSTLEEPFGEQGAPDKGAHRGYGACTVACLVATLLLQGVVLVVLYACHAVPVPGSNAVAIAGDVGGEPVYRASALPSKRTPEVFAQCAAAMEHIDKVDGLVYGYTSASKAVELLYTCSKVNGLFEKAPAHFHGVFWMRGSDGSDVLASLQMGQWFESQRLYLVPFAPFMWAWTAGRSEDAARLAGARDTMSFKFGACPKRSWLTWPPGAPSESCEPGAGDDFPLDLQYAEVQKHPAGDLRLATRETLETLHTLEARPDSPTGQAWRLGAYSGRRWMGGCRCFSEGGREFVKVLDGAGAPIQPYYSELIEHMGGASLVMWSGVVPNATGVPHQAAG